MAQLITLPAVVADATDAVIESWMVEPGAQVDQGQPIAEIETEKATVEMEAEASGTIAKLLVTAGSTVDVGTPVAVLAGAGDGDAEINAALATIDKQEQAGGDSVSQSSDSSGQAPAHKTSDQAAAEESSSPAKDMTRIFASPLARRRANELGVGVSSLNGSGPGGRIIRSDVEGAAASSASTAEVEATPPTTDISANAKTVQENAAATSDPEGAYTEVPLTGMRKAIARRLTESKSNVPHFYLTGDICMDPLLEFRSQINESLGKQGLKATVNDLLLKGLGNALAEVPEANAIWSEPAIRQYGSVDISMAIATEGGLLTPVIRDVANLSMATLCRSTVDFKLRAAEKRIKQHELEGGAFSLSNLGMYGVREFSAIINPPQAGILAIGATESRPAVRHKGVEVASMMSVTFSADHRVVDGAVAGRLLEALKDQLEDPMRLVL